MLEPAELYELTESDVPAAAPVLVVALDGFVDAGNAARLAVGAMREGREARTLARFDVDQLIDYRSRRPPLRFDTDHWESYAAPDLDVVALTDTADTEFLLLAGPEPDSQWERFAAAVGQLVERFGVRLVINMSAIPMAVPHTRPIGVTAHGTRRELTEGHEAWFTAGSGAPAIERGSLACEVSRLPLSYAPGHQGYGSPWYVLGHGTATLTPHGSARGVGGGVASDRRGA